MDWPIILEALFVAENIITGPSASNMPSMSRNASTEPGGPP